MRGSGLGYLVTEGFRNLWHNRTLAITSIAILTTCLILVGAAFLITANIESIIEYIGEQSEIVVFLKDVDDEATAKVDTTIRAMDNVASATYISKEEGLLAAKEMIGDKGFLFDGLEGKNIIPVKYVIKVKDVAKTAQTAAALRSIDSIELVNSADEVATTLTDIRNTVNTFGFSVIVALGIISLVIISNTIRSTIFARRKEISIMKYVGATNRFIRIPFVIEGFILGIVSATIAFFAVWGVYHYVIQSFTGNTTLWIKTAFERIIPFELIAFDLGIFFLATGIALGTIGSFLNIRKHLKV